MAAFKSDSTADFSGRCCSIAFERTNDGKHVVTQSQTRYAISVITRIRLLGKPRNLRTLVSSTSVSRTSGIRITSQCFQRSLSCVVDASLPQTGHDLRRDVAEQLLRPTLSRKNHQVWFAIPCQVSATDHGRNRKDSKVLASRFFRHVTTKFTWRP